MNLRNLGHAMLGVGALLSVTTIASAGPISDHEDPPLLDYPHLSSTAVLQGSVVHNSAMTEFTYESVDAAGRRYDAYINTVTGEVQAATSDTMVANVLSPQQLETVRSKYVNAGAPPTAQGYVVPVIVAGAMCYINDNITKERARRHCDAHGQTVVMQNSGVCGFGANFRCENNPAPNPQPEPLPSPGPEPDPRDNLFGWTLPDPTNVSGPFQLVVNTYDGDWFNGN